MPRPNLFNLKYFPVDVVMWDDHKFISIEETAGIRGSYIATRIMAMVYQDQGYYLDWPANFETTVSKRIGRDVTGAEVKAILELSLTHGLFSREKFESHGVITSAGIQKRWREVMKLMRRKVVVAAEIWLISSEETLQTSEVNRVSSEETHPPTTFSTQNEMKGKERKKDVEATSVAPIAENSTTPSPEQPTRKRIAAAKKYVVDNPPTQIECGEYFLNKCYNPKSPAGSWFPDTCRREAYEFYNHYTGNGWVQGKGGKKLVSWQAAANLWIIRAKRGEFSNIPGRTVEIIPGTAPVKVEDTRSNGRLKELPAKSQDINYLFARFLEDPKAVTVEQIDPSDYDHAKQAGKVNYGPDQTKLIREEAEKMLKAKELEATGPMLNTTMKKIAMLSFFRDMAAAGKTEIFTLITN